jgi:hypothetical protein
VTVEWDRAAPTTAYGQLPFFIDFLKTSGLFDAFVADCPLVYVSGNAPKTRDVLGTTMLSMLAGHRRYAHISALRFDGVLPELLGMTKIVSEDSVRRGLKRIDAEAGASWARGHLMSCLEPILDEPWILDADTTIKPICGHQEGAEVGNNPKKPGRPSHCYHSFSMASTRLILDVDVTPGDEHTSNYAAPTLWALLSRLPRDRWPRLLRGDAGFGVEAIMAAAEARELAYLFKLRLTKNVRRMVEKLAGDTDWVDAGKGFQAKTSEVRLTGWSRQRGTVVFFGLSFGAVEALISGASSSIFMASVGLPVFTTRKPFRLLDDAVLHAFGLRDLGRNGGCGVLVLRDHLSRRAIHRNLLRNVSTTMRRPGSEFKLYFVRFLRAFGRVG